MPVNNAITLALPSTCVQGPSLLVVFYTSKNLRNKIYSVREGVYILRLSLPVSLQELTGPLTEDIHVIVTLLQVIALSGSAEATSKYFSKPLSRLTLFSTALGVVILTCLGLAIKKEK